MPVTSYEDRSWDLEYRRRTEYSILEAAGELQHQVPTTSVSLGHSSTIRQVEGEHGPDFQVKSYKQTYRDVCAEIHSSERCLVCQRGLNAAQIDVVFF